MSCFMIEGYISFLHESQCTFDDFQIIFIDDIAVFQSYYFVVAHAFTHTQCQRTVFFFIAKREFTFIAVACFRRRTYDAFPAADFNICIFQQAFYLSFLQFQFFFMFHCLICAATAEFIVGTHTFCSFQRGIFHNFQQFRFYQIGFLFKHLRLYFLTGHSISDCYAFPFKIAVGFIGKVHILNFQCDDIFFLHGSLQMYLKFICIPISSMI